MVAKSIIMMAHAIPCRAATTGVIISEMNLLRGSMLPRPTAARQLNHGLRRAEEVLPRYAPASAATANGEACT